MLDSGCTQHMTGYVKMFTSIDEDMGDHEHITFGDNSKGKVVGLGKVAITKDHSISNVLLVESVSFNLLSIAQLCDLGLICTFSDSEVVVTSKEDKNLLSLGSDTTPLLNPLVDRLYYIRGFLNFVPYGGIMRQFSLVVSTQFSLSISALSIE